MKKLFTLVALLTFFMGAKAQAQWEQVYSIDYSTYTGFPFYVMGYVPEFDNGCMADFGSAYRYETQENLDGDGDGKWKEGEESVGTVKTAGGTEYQKVTGAGAYWHQYFIADGIQTVIDETYKVVAKVKASEAVSINVNMGWGWGSGEQMGTSVAIPQSDDFQEVEWEYSGIGGSNCNLVAQPGTASATIEWLSLVVYHKVKQGARPKEWIEDIVNGDAETPWGELADVKFNDQENNFKICAWGKEREVNMNEDGGWDPFPATIEDDGTGNHVFVVHGKAATTEGDASAWDNQFWIQSQHEWKSGTQLKIKFRYKASKEVTVATQCHKQNPSDYLIWHAIGDISFGEDWKTFDNTLTIGDDMGGTWSIAFQLNQNDKEAIDFYFDDLSWQYLKLDNGYFVSGVNTAINSSYDNLDNAIEFTEGEDGVLEAVIGELGNKDSYVNQIMISTVRGDDAAFKGATLKPSGTINNDPDEWLDYAAAGNQRLNLPGTGVWKVWIDTEYNAMAFQMLEGVLEEPIEVVTNPTEVIVKGQERDWRTADNDGNPIEAEIGTGQPWDNQFWIVANRKLQTGDVTVLKFKYRASKEAKTSTQCHADPGAYLHWGAIGDVNFTEDWQDFETEFTVPSEANDMLSIAFNMAEIKEACDYELKDFQWYLQYSEEGLTMENLIDATGAKNFYVKEGAGDTPHVFGTESGVSSLVYNNKVASVSYNLAGQRVSKGYKGIVVKNGSKVVVK